MVPVSYTHLFYDLKEFLKPGDLLVFNDTKVIPARLYGKKETGGACEFLIERMTGESTALSHIKACLLYTSQALLKLLHEHFYFLLHTLKSWCSKISKSARCV